MASGKASGITTIWIFLIAHRQYTAKPQYTDAPPEWLRLDGPLAMLAP